MKVRCINVDTEKMLTIGKVYDVINETKDFYRVYNDKLKLVGMYKWRFEIVKESNDMKKSDLRTGMVVETRDNKLYVVFKDAIFEDSLIGTEHIGLTTYKEDLKQQNYDVLDIMKVYETNNIGIKLFYKRGDRSNLKLLWERKDNSKKVAALKLDIDKVRESLKSMEDKLNKMESEV